MTCSQYILLMHCSIYSGKMNNIVMFMNEEGILKSLASLLTHFQSQLKFQNLFFFVSDPRTTAWPFMNSPIPTVLMVLGYLYVVLIVGPRIMANRKPFKLREVLILYNGFQVLFSLFMLYEVMSWYPCLEPRITSTVHVSSRS